MKIGYLGLGKMGKNMVLRFLEQGIDVVAWNRSEEPRKEVAEQGADTAASIELLVQKLDKPKIIWLMLPAGDIIDEILHKLIPLLSPGDIVIDGANSFYKDTLARGELLKQNTIQFMDIGVSGGPDGARDGACLMVGGRKNDFETILPLIKAAAAPDAYGYFGPLGSGHFAKMVHNGIEYGMMQAIAEGAAVLKRSAFTFDLVEVFRTYNNRSVIESRLIEWTRQALEEDPELSQVSSSISASGEGEWTVKTARELDVDVPVIEKSYQVRLDSQNEKANPSNTFRNKVVSAQRGKFGHHKVTKE